MNDRTCILCDEGGSPLIVDLRLGQPDEEGWLPFQINLRQGETSIAACREQIREVDLAALADGLRSTAHSGERLSWVPTQPSFLVWAYQHPSGIVNVTIMVDDGVASGSPSTDTGLAFVVALSAATIDEFAACLIG
jgi:hypothetical protein